MAFLLGKKGTVGMGSGHTPILEDQASLFINGGHDG